MWTVIAIISVFSLISFVLSIIALMGMFKISDRLEMIESLLREDLQPPPPVEEVSSELMQGYKNLKTEENKHLEFIALARKRQQGMGFDTGGDLIPANLTQHEQEVLRDFYTKENNTP